MCQACSALQVFTEPVASRRSCFASDNLFAQPLMFRIPLLPPFRTPPIDALRLRQSDATPLCRHHDPTTSLTHYHNKLNLSGSNSEFPSPWCPLPLPKSLLAGHVCLHAPSHLTLVHMCRLSHLRLPSRCLHSSQGLSQ